MTSPAVTIIVPVYNGSAYLRETLDSLLSQSFKSFELLVIDDGSTDGSAHIVSSMKDGRMRFIRQSNRGLCDALNRGIEEARTPFIARNDQDDLSFPNRIARQIEVMNEHPDALALFAYYTKFGARRRWSNVDKYTVVVGDTMVYDPLRDGCMLGSTMFARTEALRMVNGFRRAFYPTDDWDLEFRLAEAGKVLILREPLVAYRFHTSANTYRTFAEMQQKASWVKDCHSRRMRHESELPFEVFLASQPKNPMAVLKDQRVEFAKLQMRLAGQQYLDGHYLRTILHLLGALILNPRDIVSRFMRITRYALAGGTPNH
jgi:glycosyltransferase involved in cell wall biosynthesis